MDSKNTPTPEHSKRLRTEPSTCLDTAFTTTPTTSPNVPTFLVIHSDDKPLGRVSPFLIEKGLKGLAGTLKSVKKLRSGDLLVETANPAQSRCLLKSSMLADIKIVVSAHSTLNYSRGVISEVDLLDISDGDLCFELQSQGVIAARRITIKRGADIVPTKHIILTFSTPSLPSNIKAGYLHCSVRPYVPNPLRCFKCQKYGHSKTSCRGVEICAKCSSKEHTTDNCSTDAHLCANCRGDHPAFSRSCPKWKEERAIQELKTAENISYPEARRRLAPSTPSTKSYAAALRSTVTCSVQTDITVPPNISFSEVLRKYAPSASGKVAAHMSTNTAVSLTKAPVTSKSKDASTSKPTSFSKGKGSRKVNRDPTSKFNLRRAIDSNRFSPLEEDSDSDRMDVVPSAPPPPSSSSHIAVAKPRKQPILPPE